MATSTLALPTLIVASAGTGKTYQIIECIVTLLEQADARLEQIGVITFTEAAAAELRQRVRKRLQSCDHPEADHIAAAKISTIHSFALGLLERHSLYLGMAASAFTLEEQLARTLRTQALNLALLDPALSAAVTQLKEVFKGDAERIKKVVFALLERAQALRLTADQLMAHQLNNRDFLAAAFGPGTNPRELDTALQQTLEARLELLSVKVTCKTDRAPLERSHEAHGLALQGKLRQAAELLVTLPKGTKQIEPILAELRSAGENWLLEHPDELTHLLALSDAVYALAASATARYEESKRARHCWDFNDQIARALELLEQEVAGEKLASYLARELPYLLVDEFQDTSPLQYRLTETLRRHGCQVTYVGDLKQAIYGWRDADSRLLLALLERAINQDHQPHTLATNWRSHPDLVAFTNELFAPACALVGLPFEPVNADGPLAQLGIASPLPRIEVALATGRTYSRPADFIARLCQLVAEKRLVLDPATTELRPLRWGDIAILERSHQRLDSWADKLSEANIPLIREAGSWSEQPEVKGAIAWLRCLANPYDTQALADTLCSDYFGLPPEQLASLACSGLFKDPAKFLETPEAWEALANQMPTPATAGVLRRFRQAWLQGREALASQPLLPGIRDAYETIAAESLLLSLPNGPQRRANFLRILELAAVLEASSAEVLALRGLTAATLENLLVWLQSLPDSEEDRQPRPAFDDNAVNLLTMHRAKGLEFPVVVVPNLSHNILATSPRCSIDWPEDPNLFLSPDILAHGQLRFVPPLPAVAELAQRFGQAAADAAGAREELCLLYVAFTRARDYLLLGWLAEAKPGTLQSLLDISVAGNSLAGQRIQRIGDHGNSMNRTHQELISNQESDLDTVAK
ncbi:MAG: UvrD-helicase domain-containing protein [Cyanobacteria bacterium NC_groundwater_1444_Ag_S-0.65um_54_12]|nr:UvrD-helicase domain-containing protein [Cyanobacteria bacterium NC_groundwater_1444_Ag_S-0.65um_54_12]